MPHVPHPRPGRGLHGDIPAFLKKSEDGEKEEAILERWAGDFPRALQRGVAGSSLRGRWIPGDPEEAKLYKALDNLEAVIQHDESDIASWLPLEYELQLTYGRDKVAFSPYLQGLKARSTTGPGGRSRKARGELNRRNAPCGLGPQGAFVVYTVFFS